MFVYSFFSAACSAGFGAPLRRVAASTARRVARAAMRAVYAGNPLTPTGYAILAMTILAVALVALLSTWILSNELESALRVSWWFS